MSDTGDVYADIAPKRYGRSDRMLGAATREVCPHCDAPGARLSLLTSMTRYYVCGECARRWQVERTSEADAA